MNKIYLSVLVVLGLTVSVPIYAYEKFDSINLNEVVVTANHHLTLRREAPVLINILTPKVFEVTASNCLADGLSFEPGLRIEDNCATCGMKQARINGLDGHYSQILIDSHPIFSSLSSIYGLELIPENMIDRTEIMRGGGSALYGSSAVGGTINVITRTPLENSAEVKHTVTSIGGKSCFDNNTEVNASTVLLNNKGGLYVFGQNRYRQGYDSNGDALTELPRLSTQTFGTKALLKTGLYQTLSINYLHTESTHRGGGNLDSQPDQASVAEQAEHKISQGGVDFKSYSIDSSQHFSVYSAFTNTLRNSYSGGKDAVGTADPTQFYTKTTDFLWVSGVHYCYSFDKMFFMPSELTVGAEYSYDHLVDNFLCVNSKTVQTQGIVGGLFQNEWKTKQVSILVGARIDKTNLLDHTVLSPRVYFRYNLTKEVNLRAGYSGGFRAPQTFDEDLHVDMAGGERFRVKNMPGLKEEQSHSFSLSGDLYHSWGGILSNLMVEGFYTKLNNAFSIRTTDNVDADGSTIRERYNGSNAHVMGLNVVGRVQYAKMVDLEAGITLQQSRYSSPQAWSDDESVPAESKIFRSPNCYGYFTMSIHPTNKLTLSTTGTYTGSMLVTHETSSGVNKDVAINTPSFFDEDLRISCDFTLYAGIKAKAALGIRNTFNAYQKDFDKGANRDSDYIYGPSLPRSYYASLSISL